MRLEANALTKTGKRRAVAATAALMCCLLAGCDDSRSAAPAPSADATGQPYEIGPGDHLSVFVYGSPSLSVTDLTVGPDGHIALPLVPDLAASGRTPAALAAEIEAGDRRYLKDPHVSVMVRDYVGLVDRDIRIIGEAAEPLTIPYRQHMTVLDVVIAAHGLTRFAAGNRAVLMRHEPDGTLAKIHVHLADLVKEGDISQNVAVQPGDTLLIPQAWF